MDISDRGYRFYTVHNDGGAVAHVDAYFERFQEQAPIKRNQPFVLDFYGKGAGIRLGVTAMPRRKPPSTLAAERRRRVDTVVNNVRAASAALKDLSFDEAGSGTGAPEVVMRAVNPEFHSPFDDKLFDWGLPPPVFPPPNPNPPGGGGGGTYHSAVRIQLFVYNTPDPIQTWELPEGVGDRVRFVEYQPQGFPSLDAPVRRTGWWRMIVTPIGPDPVEIYVTAQTKLGDVPIRTTPLNVRLTDHLFRVALEALVPQAAVDWDTVRFAIGPEIAEMIGIEPLLFEHSISPGNSHAKLRSLNITSVSGAEFHDVIQKRFEERVKRYPRPPGVSASNTQALINFYFKRQVERLQQVQPDDVVLRIQAQFADASVSVWGFDVAELDGELGELDFVFSHRLDRLLPFSFLDVDFSALVDTIKAIVLPFVRIFTEVTTDVNKIIEDAIIDGGAADSPGNQACRYMRAFLERAVGLNSTVFELRYQNKAWQIRNSVDPHIPLPTDVVLDPLGGLAVGGVISMMARSRLDLGETREEIIAADAPAVMARSAATAASPVAEPAAADSSPASSAAAAAATARVLPAGYLTPGPQLDRLDRHQSIVVVMMENRSYDHMLGDLMNARPGNKPVFPYDGAPSGATNAPVGGFMPVPLVRTRDINIGTQIPVSPRHYYDPVQFQIGDGTEDGAGSGDMQGFARDLYHKSDSPQLAMTVYGEAELPVHYKIADEFVTCDRWFAAHPGPTFPNRFATMMGTIPELDNFENEDPRIGYLKHRTIFDALSGAGVDWKVFESDLSQIRMFDKFRLDDQHVVPINDPTDGLEATLKRYGPLPRVMFVEPNFADIPPVKTADDDHPPADLTHGQAFLSRVCDLLWDSGRFDEVLMVITYDEHGGFYDHVPPPGTAKGEPGVYAKLHKDGPTYLGVRVPTFVISPYVSSGRADRTIFDHTSILKTILVHNRDRFSVDTMLSFGGRVNQMPDLSVLLDLETPRGSPVPFIRRAGGGQGGAGAHGAFADLADRATEFSDGSPPTTTFALTPKPAPIVTDRAVPPGADADEPRDFHVAMTKMLRPRRKG